MPDHRADFKQWFVEAMAPLKTNGPATFIFAMVAFPLLERYLRGKCNIPDSSSGLNSDAYAWLNKAFPDLSNRAIEFWPGYRHALLHQVTFQDFRYLNRQKVVIARPHISGFDIRPVYLNASENCFYLNPVAFFDFVIDKILNDFSHYESPSLPLPTPFNPMRVSIPTAITAGVSLRPYTPSAITGQFPPKTE